MTQLPSKIVTQYDDAPVVRVDSALPALTTKQLNEGYIRECFVSTNMLSPVQSVSLTLPENQKLSSSLLQPAAVLLPLTYLQINSSTRAFGRSEQAGNRVMLSEGKELSLLLTRRSEHLSHHPGQIAFPGGRVEPSDKSLVEAALRETQEEVGITPTQVEVFGRMPEYETVSSYMVTPVVGLVKDVTTLTLCEDEVHSAFTVPLSYLMTPAHHRWHQLERAGASRQWLSIEYESSGQLHVIWGITAAIIRHLYETLRKH